MRWKTIITLSLVLLIAIPSLFILTSAQVQKITDVTPTITANFNETVTINESVFFNKDLLEFIPAEYSTDDGETYYFYPQYALSNGEYDLVIVASDHLGNTPDDPYRFTFELFLPEPLIEMISPNAIGVSNSTTFDVVIRTLATAFATCKYKASPIDDYHQLGLQEFEGGGTNTHTISDYSVPVDNPRPLFIICEDDLTRRFSAAYVMYSDLTDPTLDSVNFNPGPIVEYPLEGDIRTIMSANTDEPALCKYTRDPDQNYRFMTHFDDFDLMDFDAFKGTNEVTLAYPINTTKETFTYYVRCEDRAGRLSDKVTALVEVDLTAALDLKVITPSTSSKETYVVLNLTTNKLGYCRYKKEGEAFTDMSTDPFTLDRFHYVDLGVFSTGSYTYEFYCFSDQSGEDEEVTRTYTFVIDTVPPTTPTINTSSLACSNTVEATASSSDPLSGVNRYVWKLIQGVSAVIANGTSTDGKIVASQNRNGTDIQLVAGTTYKFSVYAVDNAGNSGPEGTSGSITFDATGISCDKTPPVVFLERSVDGFSAKLNCTDDISGCFTFKVGTATEGLCNATEYKFPPFSIPIFMAMTICWEVSDNAQNWAIGSEFVELNISGGLTCGDGIDNDGDGYGERCTAGWDCDDTDPNVFVNCASGCIQDTDGDGYGMGCIKGNDCNGKDANLTTICPNGCISDNDGDGYGLGCNDGPDCDGTDSTAWIECASGCLDDNDGDGLGLLCIAGLDCDGEDPNEGRFCDNNCISDLDSDGYGLGCDNGVDCSGRDPTRTIICENGCILDEDGDGYGLGCLNGLDTDGLNPFITNVSPNNCQSDNDGDGYGWSCDKGTDCDDTDYSQSTVCKETGCLQDTDGDGLGLCCDEGFDCDDFNPALTANCTANCTFDLDCDRMWDGWEDLYGLNTTVDDADENPDEDSYTNLEEFCLGFDPTKQEFKEEDIEEEEEEVLDTDEDGMLDQCENAYPGVLDPTVDDANEDFDGDGLFNIEECLHIGGLCRMGTDPGEPDTDFDGASDYEEIEAFTDPCDPDSKPAGGGFIGIVLIILGLLMIAGGTAWGVYKRYYLPLLAPKPKPKPVAPARGPFRLPVRTPVRHFFRPKPKPKPKVVSRDKFIEAQKKKVEERLKVFDTFGAARQREARRAMSTIAKKKKVTRRVIRAEPEIRPAVKKKLAATMGDDQVKKLSKIITSQSFDRLTQLTKGQADEFHKLAKIVHEKKDEKLEKDEVDKLAKVTAAVARSKPKKETLKKVIKKSDFDVLDSLPSKKKKLDTLLGHVAEPGGADVFDALNAISAPKKKPGPADQLARIAEVESKEDLESMFAAMSKQGKMDKNVFQVILSYLLKGGKITKRDVSEMLFDLQKQGVLSHKDVSDVFFHLGIQR